MTQPSRRIKCRVCAFEIPAVYTNRKGKVKTGWGAMLAHVIQRAEIEERDPLGDQSHGAILDQYMMVEGERIYGEESDQ